MAGFRYQILQSVHALLGLEDPTTELLLEVEEDYSVRSEDLQTDVQVKNSQAIAGPPAWSLQSDAIRSAILRLWRVDDQASRVRRQLVFLARGGHAVERGHSMPGGVSGIEYWRSAAIGADTAPLRTLLQAAFRDTELGTWLEQVPSDEELRERLLRRVSFELEQLPSDTVFLSAKDKLRALYAGMNLPVVVADMAVTGLIDLVFQKASLPNPPDRRLRRSDLEALLQDFAGKALVVERMARPPALADDLLLAPVVLPTNLATRASTVDGLVQQHLGQPLIWIHGAHGTGKSTIARLLAARFTGQWLVLDLWAVRDQPLAALSAWRDLLSRISPDGITGIIVDNVVGAAGQAIADRLASFARTFAPSGGRVIVTSHQQPLPQWLSDAGSTAPPIAAPYFSEEDILELVEKEPQPSDSHRAWALMIGAASAGGHPTLVSTKIASLRARAWPKDALFEDVGATSEGVQLTREAARRKLLDNLRDLDSTRSFEAGQLLRRIGSAFDRVDERLALKLAALDPPLQSASDALAMLKGTWLEVLPKGDLRVSPLIADITNDVQPEETKLWRRSASIYWISKRKLDDRTLPLCFWNAYLGEQDWVLVKLAETMQTMGSERFKSAAPMLSPITALTTDGFMYSGNFVTSVMLRVLQIAIATALDQHDIARKAASRLLVELDGLDPTPRALLTATGALQVLMSDAELPFAQRMNFAVRLRSAYPAVQQISGGDLEDPKRLLPPQLRSDMDTSDFLITRIVGKIHTGSDFLEAVEAFDALPAETRNRFLDTIDIMYGGLSVLASSGWAGDQLAKRDMDATYATYTAAEFLVGKWQRKDMEIEVVCARSVILDECLERKDEALAVILAAIDLHGTLPALVRQEARVLAHLGRHSEAVDLTITIEDSISPRDGLEHVLAIRDGAVSAGKSRRFDEAIRLFAKARDRLTDSEDRWPIRTGILVETSLAQWRSGAQADAIRTAAQVLQELERFGAQSSRQAERVHQYGRGLIGLLHQEPARAPHVEKPPFDFGQASQLELTNAELMSTTLASLPDNWLVLAAVEADLGQDLGIADLARSKQPSRLHANLEANLHLSRYATAVSREDVDTAIASLAAIRHIATTVKPAKGADNRADASHFTTRLADFYTASNYEMISLLVLDLASYQVVRGSYDQAFMRRIATAFERIFGDSILISPLLDAATQLYAVGSGSREPFLLHGFTKHVSKVAESPAARLMRDLTLLTHGRYSLVRSELVPAIIKHVSAGWRVVAKSGNGGLELALAEVYARKLSPQMTAVDLLTVVGQQMPQYFSSEWFVLDWLTEEAV
jgi:hypothetical protein